ncbi:hypothetical protein [Botrimarina mediterranea]|uniref:hypothetical protein n=1 Tax=Botrimarina mediterranea TaxID=2528022 RepID=UPI00118C4A80|nr:hypothetical protein K2D_16830 [Planctomycetes bacterium K2D]
MAKLHERVAFERAGNVDRESGVISGVKLLGLVSKNGRRYSESALRKASDLYEGAPVYLNHCKPGQSRDVRDMGGEIRGVKFREGEGLFGDVHYLKGDSAGEKIATLAEGNLRKVGMSHDADGEIKRVGGENVVEEITEVNSVDVVHNPATTKSFREQTMKTTLRKLLEATPYKHTAKLLEMMPELAAEEPIDVPEVEEGDAAPDPIDAVANALAAKVADAIKDPAVTDAEVGQMAKAASKTVANVRADMEPKSEAPAEESEGEPEGDAGEEETTEAIVAKHVGKLTEQIESLTKERDARLVLESKEARVTPQLLDELTACKDRAAMEALVEGWAPAKLGKQKPAIGRLREGVAVPDSADSYLASLKARGLR